MLLKGQRFVVTGIASKLSIAWAIAECLHREGAELILTYPNDKIKKRVDMAAETFGAVAVLPCDVSSDDEIVKCFDEVARIWDDGVNGVVHAIGFAPAEQLDGDFTDATTREGFAIAHDVSSYSFVALAKASRTLLAKRQGSLLTLTYEGSISVLPNYNVMGLAKASLNHRCVIWQARWVEKAFVSMPLVQVRFARLPPVASSHSVKCWTLPKK